MLEVVSGASQFGVAGKELGNPVVVHAVDNRGHDVKNQAINFRVVSGEGSVFAGVSITTEHGIAQEHWTLGTDASTPQVLEARAVDSVTGEAIVFARFEATASPDLPSLGVAGRSTTNASPNLLSVDEPGSHISTSIVDAFGNPIAGLSVAFASSGGILSDTGAVTDADGVAEVVLISTSVGTVSVTATIDAWPVGTPSQVTFTHGVAAKGNGSSSLFTLRAAAPDDGTTLDLLATIRDQYGNPVPGAVVLFDSSGPSTIVQPTGATGPDGVAVGKVSALIAGVQLVTATIEGAEVAATEVHFTAAPVSGVASSVLLSSDSIPPDGTQVEIAVTALDAIQRPVANQTVTIAYSGSALITPVSAVTNGLGVALFHSSSMQETSGTVLATIGTPGASVIVDSQPFLAFLAPTFVLGGTIAGLRSGSLTLQSSGLQDVTVLAGQNTFAFPQRIRSGTDYSVTVRTDPAGQKCLVSTGAGTIATVNVSNITVTCSGIWRQLSAGYAFTLGIRQDDTLWAWGRNTFGQLGIGTSVGSVVPVQVGHGGNWKAVAAGLDFAVGITQDGTLWAWGNNEFGQLGNGTLAPESSPIQVGEGSDWVAVASGTSHALAIRADRTLWGWGRNDFGSVGSGTATTAERVPVQVGDGGSTWVAIAAGWFHSVAVNSDGSLWTWGRNIFGQLGDGGYSNQETPIRVGGDFGDTDWAAIAAGGDHTAATKTDGSLWSWGYNHDGQIGDGTIEYRHTPVRLGNDLDWSAIALGPNHSIGTKSDGSLWTWGWNYYGQLGIGNWNDAHSPVPVVANDTFAVAVAGQYHSLALALDGHLEVWGANEAGQLGDGSGVPTNTPVHGP
jgi:alpha-tubulin suppressor-like RCC1 family protein